MVTRLNSSVPGTTIYLFGSQSLSLNDEYLCQLKTTLLNTLDYQWAVETVEDLQNYWGTISNALPQLQSFPGMELLQNLDDWLKTEGPLKVSFPLPNILLTPLTVIAQLVQYSRYLDAGRPNAAEGESQNISLHTDTEIIGLCTGLLSAFAVSSATSRAQLKYYGAVAIRQAMLIGALVDAQDASDSVYGPSKSFATAWNTAEGGAEMERILDHFPEAYKSVFYDENRATITTSERTAPKLLERLRAAGVSALEVGFRGRFHSKHHLDDLDSVIKFCDSQSNFQFPDASQLVMPTRFNSGEGYILEGKLHHIALRSILAEPPNWYQTLANIQSFQTSLSESSIVSFGPDRCIPPSLMKTVAPRLLHLADLVQKIQHLSPSLYDSDLQTKYLQACSENDIAVVGMSCKVAGADDLEEFWNLLCKGQSQHVEVPKERLQFETQWRDLDPKRKWYGNFIRDHDAFDHKFFKKSPREVISQDPQQRLMMQIAYQAVEQSGYFQSPMVDKHIGCYIGVCAADYENNVACHPANAFSATGNLKSFIAGKISHYFGWTGPGLTIDTACSASAVAIHQACMAILSGECTAALAGGTNIMTNPLWFQNLAAASFLSPTGACKPFDDSADGYCRGEGIAAVFLKKMSTALADGDQIFGCISGTAVHQNQNCTPIVVPNAPSLSNLFRHVTQKAKVEPQDISVVEAHGTGTAAGDPAEYESIRQVFGAPRSIPLAIGSVKGLVGHTECASGIIALIKVLLMIQESAIPPQASFKTLSHRIKPASSSDMMEIVIHKKPWDVEFRAALINNYGASGSNASLVVTQPFRKEVEMYSPIHSPSIKHPFWLCGFDEESLRKYSTKLNGFIKSRSVSAKHISVANLAFNVSRQSNKGLNYGLIFNSSSISDLEDKLTAFVNGKSKIPVTLRENDRPVIMCFGGQRSTFVGLDRKIYDSVRILRNYLDQCDSILQSIGLSGIYPDIFQRSPIADTIKLQTILFALQYSCAKTWIDCGVQVAAVVGHSFGELTALCISGVLTLKDTAKLIMGRARIIQDSWGSEKGSMMALEASFEDVERLLATSSDACMGEQPATIACFNGPRSFTIAGSVKSIDSVAETVLHPNFSSMKTKRLNVTNAFHSTLVEPLVKALEVVAQDMDFREPIIPWERATESAFTGKIETEFVAEHMRHPVYFNHAVQRLASQYPSAIWLEAGSDSTITSIASRALGSLENSFFQSVNITVENGLQNLTDVTTSLWKSGLRTQFWAHHSSQTYDYGLLVLPPYQFQKSRHWLEMKKPMKVATESVSQSLPQEQELPKGLWTFSSFLNEEQRSARFRVNTMAQKYKDFVSCHRIAQTAPICPATLQIDMAIEALISLKPGFIVSNLQPQIHSVVNQSPICLDPSRLVWLDFEACDIDLNVWNFKISSNDTLKVSPTNIHVTGQIIFCHQDDPQINSDFATYERLVDHKRCLKVLNGDDADDIIQGRNIYRTFAEIVDYGEIYRGVQKIVGRGMESAGRIAKKYTGETWLDAHLSDCFSQVGGIWVNCMTDRPPTDMYIACGFEKWIRSPKVKNGDIRPELWDVFASHHRSSDKSYTTDIFVFNPTNGALMEIILGINYVKVSKMSMSKILSRLTDGSTRPSQAPAVFLSSEEVEGYHPQTSNKPILKPVKQDVALQVKNETKHPLKEEIFKRARAILASLSGLESSDIEDDTELADIGIDSLMGMELSRDIEQVFQCSILPESLMDVTNLATLVDCIQSTLGGVEDGTSELRIDTTEGTRENFNMSNEWVSVGKTPTQSASATACSKLNVAEYLAELLGISEGEVVPGTLLRDLGVDSLLSTEVRTDMASKAGIRISEDISIEELTVQELDATINGCSESVMKVACDPVSEEAAETFPRADGISSHSSGITAVSANNNLKVSASKILEAFGETKLLTDQFIADYRCVDYLNVVMPKQTELCVTLALEAFEQLGCYISEAKAGEKLERIKYIPNHERLVEYLYTMLEKGARLIDMEGSQIVRTGVSWPKKSASVILQDLIRSYPDHIYAHKLTYFCGVRLADVLTGKSDGIKLIFGSEEGRELVSGLYGDSLLNKLAYKQMEDFLRRLISKLPKHEGPLRILEMGAGTGGTTKGMVPLLASLNMPVEYTFTDLSPSMVAAARKKYKEYSFMKFRTHDIEKTPATDLLNTQHIVIASNAVHATHSLTESTRNIRKALRPDGFLMMLEMTETMYWIDVIFGLLEGWWLFEDGRQHAIAHQSRWKKDLHSVGYGHVDWTDGHQPEVNIQRIIIALASGERYECLPLPPKPISSQDNEHSAREAIVEEYVRQTTEGFSVPTPAGHDGLIRTVDQCVLVSGATGSLGSHLVAHLVELPHITTVICMNRRSGKNPVSRQEQAFKSRGIELVGEGVSKLRVLEADTAKPMLGLLHEDYQTLLSTTTHIIHNAWPMNGKMPVKNFEAQFRTMRNLIDLACEISQRRTKGFRVSFQLVSSIATVGYYPLWSGNVNVPEEKTKFRSVLSNGYGDAKFVCERILDETLHKYPDQFRTMTVRLGQVAGSKISGYWNPKEHLSFLVKSSQTLKALPDFDGLLSWTPVNDVAATLGDLLLAVNTPYPIYHIDNPIRQEWREVIRILADALYISDIVPFDEWLKRVRAFPGSSILDNPAANLLEFLDENFIRMSCGGLLLDTKNSREHSPTLANLGPVGSDTVRKYIQAWKDSGFLNE